MKKYFLLITFLYSFAFISAQSKEDQVCLDCHNDKTLIAERGGKKVSMFINGKDFAGSGILKKSPALAVIRM